MTVDEIIKQVRLCIDEESCNTSSISDEKDDEYMDHIIKARIPDAIVWLSMNAPARSLVIPTNSSDDLVKDYDTSSQTKEADGLQYTRDWNVDNGIGCVTFPSDHPLRLLRVRGCDWCKAIKQPYEEDSDEALFMYDDTAKGTPDRPLAVIVMGNPTRLLVQPNSESVSLSFVRYLCFDPESDADADLPIPDSARSSFIYYLAYLLLSAYEDTKASLMYTIALQQLGISQTAK